MVLIKPHSETHPVQTIHPTDLGLIPTWKSIVWAPAQGFPASWDARKRVQERVKFQENPGNLYFQKTAENRLKSGKLKKNKTTFTLTTLKVVRVKVVLFFLISRF